MQYTDLRDWIQKVDELGELRRVEGIDWDLEMGAVTEVYARNEPYPSILFDKIKDYPAGHRVLVGVHHMSLKRQLLTLHMPANDTDFIRRAWSGPLDPVIPRDRKGFSSRAIIDATRPYEWIKDYPLVSGASPELKKRVAAKYGKFFS